MNRRILVAFAAAFAMAACSQAQPGGDPASTVQALYVPYMADRNPPPWRDAAPWSSEMRGLLQQLTEAERASDGIVAVDFDPMIDGQDWDIDTVAVTVTSPPAEGRAEVQAAFANMGHDTEVIYELVDEGGWRVDNIRTDSWSLRALLADAGIAPEAQP